MASNGESLPRLEQHRVDFLKSVAPDLTPILDHINGSGPNEITTPASTTKWTPEQLRKIHVANSIADLSDHDEELSRGLIADAGVTSLRDIANTYNTQRLVEMIGKEKTTSSASTKADLNGIGTVVAHTTPPKPPGAVLAFQRKIFHREPSATVARMVKDKEIKIGSDSLPAGTKTSSQEPLENPIHAGVVQFFEQNPDFNIRDTSVVTATKDPSAMASIPDHVRPEVVSSLKALQRTQALSHTPEAIPGLVDSGLTSAHAVSQIPAANFVANFADKLGGENIAKDIHAHATNVVIRNDLALTTLLQTVRGSGVAAIDGTDSRVQRVEKAKSAARSLPEPIDLEQLFGPLDTCACDDCNSVTSPAAYFVELLQYLRNNNLQTDGGLGYADTPLEVLLRRRPDLADLELTCANIKTVMPYIDLANEVMESLIVNMAKLATSGDGQVTLDVFNAESNQEGLGGSQQELLAQPQHTNDTAYCILKNAAYPSTKLPFHQPVEAIRLFLEFLHTSRAELGLVFRRPYKPPTSTIPDSTNSTKMESSSSSSSGKSSSSSSEDDTGDSDSDRQISESSWRRNKKNTNTAKPISSEDQARLTNLHELALSRADDAERLLLTEEEYIILTKEAFWTKEYFDIRHATVTDPEVYKQRIGVKPDYEYWGIDYASAADMLDISETAKTGLTFVKAQFLPRTGIAYSDLVDLLRMEFINPNMPKGRDNVILKSIRLTYKYLQHLVKPAVSDCHHHHKLDKYEPLVDFILGPKWHLLLLRLKATDITSLFDQEIVADHVECARYSGNCNCCDRQRSTSSSRASHYGKQRHPCICNCHRRYKMLIWFAKNFEKIGKLIVLESNLAELSREAELVEDKTSSIVGHVMSDGSIVDGTDATHQIGTVRINGAVVAVGDTPDSEVDWNKKHGLTDVVVGGAKMGLVGENSVLSLPDVGPDKSSLEIPSYHVKLVDTCDINKDRLRHLDGTCLSPAEYDHIHHFIRLWRKLGCSIIELDVALNVLGTPKSIAQPTTSGSTPSPDNPLTPATPVPDSEDVDWADFVDSCADGQCGKQNCSRCNSKKPTTGKGHERCGCHHHDCHYPCEKQDCAEGTTSCAKSKSRCKVKNMAGQKLPDITADFLHQLVELKKLSELTGLPWLNLLSFWGPISTSGSPSLYSQLFLTHNLLGVDQVFVADANGQYLTKSPAQKIANHTLVLMAAFGLTRAGLAALLKSLFGDSPDLTVENVSLLYRYVLLSRILGTKPENLKGVFLTLSINPFDSAAAAVDLVELWNIISDAGFTFPQLQYVFTGFDDALQPVGLSQRAILQTAMTLYTGLIDIDTQHRDITSQDAATSSALLANLSLLYSPDVAAQIAGFLEGTWSISTRAPTGLTIVFPKEETVLAVKLKYADGENPTLQSTGLLTPDETAKAKRLSTHPQWSAAVDRLAKFAATFLRKTLAGVFPPETESTAKDVLLVGDVIPAASDPNADTLATAPKKRLFFLSYFIPFLRRKLADKLTIDTVASATSLGPIIASNLLTSVISVASTTPSGQPPVTAMEALQSIRNDPKSTTGFIGYLVPDTSDVYTFAARSDSQPSDMSLDSFRIAFSVHTDDDEPSDVWSSEPIPLIGGKLYSIELREGLEPKNLMWKTDRTAFTTIPSSSLLGNHVQDATAKILTLIFKCAIIINGFSLTGDEVMYLQTHGSDFGNPLVAPGTVQEKFDWNHMSLTLWKRLADYSRLKNSLPKLGLPLIDLFKKMNGPDAAKQDGKGLAKIISTYTLWDEDDLIQLIDDNHFHVAKAANFANERWLLKLQVALGVHNKVGVDIDLLFKWAQPRIDFLKMRDIRDSIHIAIRAQMKLSDWEVAIKPTFDKLRQLQSDALTTYLINHPTLQNNKAVAIVDADSLFEFLLIDNQMCPCMETARLKQATSSVQLFVQRCMLGLEPEVDTKKLDRERWNWMQRYRVWEANRKVFLWPENWIEPSLRDDKSPISLQLESELHQKDLDKSSVMDILKTFLFNLEEIGNLEADAVFVDEAAVTPTGITRPGKVHFFARTRGTPYKFYYRTYDLSSQVWQPWQDMAVDIPRYEVEKPMKGEGPGGGPSASGPSIAKSGGFYLAPFKYNSRLMVAIPHLRKVTLPAAVPHSKIADIATNMDADESNPDEIWEIKMGISEMRNGRWTPKQITSESLTETPHPKPLPPIGAYKFVSHQGSGVVYIDVHRLSFDATNTNPLIEATTSAVGRFAFSGNHFGIDTNGAHDIAGDTMLWSDFHFQGEKPTIPPANSAPDTSHRFMYPLQRNEAGEFMHEQEAYVKYPFDDTSGETRVKYGGKPDEEPFNHPFVHELLDTAWRTDNLDDLFGYFDPLRTGSMNATNYSDAFGIWQTKTTSGSELNELNRPYSLYNWELGFHAPLTIVDRLLQNQQFDLALDMMHYIFDPLTKGLGQSPSSNTDPARCWKWPPFQKINGVEESVQNLLVSLTPNAAAPANGQITQWREHPFNPHLLARLRPVAYMKFVVVKYISILIAYGDYYFRQNTLEMIPMAIQCYVMASHLYGKPPQKIPFRGTKQVQTYKSLLNTWDAFSNALVQMEVLFPFSVNQSAGAVGVVNGEVKLANIFGLATAQYFCIPDNPDLRAVRDLIDDRLFKIRHCQDISGVERKLPLYEPPIDPGLLVAAQAAGLSLSSVLNDLNSPLPNFRFRPLLKQAIKMCEQLKEFGTALLVAKERKDCESLLALKQGHESVVHGLVMDQKKLNLQETKKAVEGLQQSRKAPEYRMKQNLQHLGEDMGTIPSLADAESEFKELVTQIEAPVVDSGIKLIAAEKEMLQKLGQSLDLQPLINSIEMIASELHALPILNNHASPFGVGIAACFGPPNIAKGIQGASKAYKAVSDFMAQQSDKISKVQGFKHTNTARVKEVNSTGHELKTIDKQIVTHQVRVAVHEADITAHEKVISNSKDVQDFLTSKYTSTELYTWVDQEVSSLYYQAYTTAYDLARKAEAAFRYERGLPATSNPPPFIKFGYWEPQNSGFLCGERLLLSLKELESTYQESRGHDFEITKHVSLRAINPLQLLRLRGDAVAEFAVPEILFDMDFPGHYGRRLKSVSVSVLPRAGLEPSPFDNFNCTLRVTAHKFRNTGIVKGKTDYPEKTDADDLRFSSVSHVPIEAIATSSPLQDSGVFELSFSDATERFLPFEGAGAISSWRLEFNEAFRGFDYDSIADVVLSLKYTSLDGGRKLRDVANGAVVDYIKSVADLSDSEGLYAVFDVPRDFPVEWAAATADASATHKLALNALNTRLPAYTKGHAADHIQTRDVWIITDNALASGDVSVRQGASVMAFSRADGKVGSGLNALHSTDGPIALRDWVVAAGDSIMGVKEMWIVVRYSLKP